MYLCWCVETPVSFEASIALDCWTSIPRSFTFAASRCVSPQTATVSYGLRVGRLRVHILGTVLDSA
jgi:hypothetical protein